MPNGDRLNRSLTNIQLLRRVPSVSGRGAGRDPQEARGSSQDLVDTVCKFGERYGTGSGSDLVDSKVVAYKAPGRYRSLYRTVLRICKQYPRYRKDTLTREPSVSRFDIL
jgi:hypothetical protein